MSSWTHLVRFVAVEDDQVHLGQLVDPTRDVGLDSTNGAPIYAFEVEGTVYNGIVTNNRLQVREVCHFLLQDFQGLKLAEILITAPLTYRSTGMPLHSLHRS